jgi:hypothetical protein
MILGGKPLISKVVLSHGAKDGCLLLTKEEWMARLKVQDGECSDSGRRCYGRGRRGGSGGR